MIEDETEATAGASLFAVDKLHLLGTIHTFDGEYYGVVVETPFLVADFRVPFRELEFDEPEHGSVLGMKVLLVLKG